MRNLDLTARARKFLAALQAKQFRQVVTKFFALLDDPKPPDSKSLSGVPYHRADIGEYRIIYRFDDESVYIALVGKRNDEEIYRQLKRMM